MTSHAATSAIDNDDDFLAKCEEELRDRFTDNDEEFMKIFNMETSIPPIVESWRVPNTARRDDRRNNRRYQPYDRQSGGRDGRHGGNRDNDRRDRGDRGNYERRGYNAYSSGYEDRRHQGYGDRQSRY